MTDDTQKASQSFTIIVTTQKPNLSFEVRTNQTTYGPNEDIIITVWVKNESPQNTTLNFPSSKQADYTIGKFRWSEDKFFTQALTSVMLGPFGVKEWEFTHTAIQYPLSVGTHIITGEVVGYGDAETAVSITVSPVPEERFVVGIHPVEERSDRMFIVSITDPTTIRQAHDCYAYGQENPSDPRCGRHISGHIASGNGGFNTNWNWHLIPGTVRMPEVSMELCDGVPNTVERDGVNFDDGIFCPWTSYILALGDQYPRGLSEPSVQAGVQVQVNALNVRGDATINAQKIGLVWRGETLKKLKEENGWVKVELSSGQTGWVFGQYVAPATVPTVSLPRQKVIVTAWVLNVRSGAGINTKVITTVQRSAVLEKVEEKSGWIKIILPSGQDGWVYGKFVK